MSTKSILFSGFGGQGILFAGKLVAYKGLMDDKNVSWLPSYGPEMRGGTASCSGTSPRSTGRAASVSCSAECWAIFCVTSPR